VVPADLLLQAPAAAKPKFQLRSLHYFRTSPTPNSSLPHHSSSFLAIRFHFLPTTAISSVASLNVHVQHHHCYYNYNSLLTISSSAHHQQTHTHTAGEFPWHFLSMLICNFPDQLSVAHSFTTHKKKLHKQN
jgi:hypothetical protein